MLLEGKKAIITGAGSGVGRASALRFAEEGARVVCADIDLERAKETVRQIEAAGGTAVAVRCDVSQEDDVSPRSPPPWSSSAGWTSCSTTSAFRRPASARCFEEHTLEDFERLIARQPAAACSSGASTP